VLKPKCARGKSFALSAEGYLLPCCWVDPLRKLKPDYDGNMDGMDDLFKEELKIENVDTVEDIIMSTEWLDFFERLTTGTKIPKICVRYCGDDKDTREEIVYD
tara:strand:+ start:205 stop:513 length:309 start_codon:yes stop_codon:yes gene_type:complete